MKNNCKKMKAIIKKLIRNVESKRFYSKIQKIEYKKIADRKSHWDKVTLTLEQVQKIEAVYGVGCDTRWHRFYQSFTGNFDAHYLPENLFAPKMECALNPEEISQEIMDKSRLPIMYGSVPGLYIPQTVILNASGIFYDKDGNVLSQEDAEAEIRNYLYSYGSVIQKPIRDSFGGKGIKVLTKESFTHLESGKNYIIQERIINQEDLRKLNPHSLNTLRVITYICDNRYWCAPIAMRMGVGEGHVDNISSGGICVGVKDTGDLCPQAYSEYFDEKFSVHPYSKIQFSGYKITNVDKVISAAIACHKRTPHIRMASWDFTINHRGEATLIELNPRGQSICFPQYTHGVCLFGENTEKMIASIQ